MIIVENTEKKILCYHDDVFMCFDKRALVLNVRTVGVAWAAGKPKNDPMDAKPERILCQTVYHNILMSVLLGG